MVRTRGSPIQRGSKASSSSSPRRRPTASERRRRAERTDVEQRSEEPEEPSQSFPGGPLDLSLLKSFETHVAANIWNGQDRDPLKLVNHGKKLQQWSLGDNCQRIHAIVLESRLGSLINCTYRSANTNIVSAFCERWQPETNSFHMPFGEMTITLDDVASILHIPVNGATISVPQLSVDEANCMLVELLGITPFAASAETGIAHGTSVRLQWLRSNFDHVNDRSTDAQIVFAARAFLLYLVGCTLFVDKTASSVSIAYLSLFTDLNNIGGYAWGAGCLAYLYRQLGMASRANVHQIAGYMTLLQAWIYEHFPSFGPVAIASYYDALPRAQRWKPRTYLESTAALREKLDDLTIHDICWEPFESHRQYLEIPAISFFSGCIKCGSIIEPYHPERVLRQFGYIQTIPPPPLAPFKAQRGTSALNYQVVYNILDQYWDRWDDHVLNEDRRGRRCRMIGECSDNYMEWYRTVSHPIIQNPSLRLSLSNPITGMPNDDRIGRAVDVLQNVISGGLDQDLDRWRGAVFYAHNILTGSFGASSSSDHIPHTFNETFTHQVPQFRAATFMYPPPQTASIVPDPTHIASIAPDQPSSSAPSDQRVYVRLRRKKN